MFLSFQLLHSTRRDNYEIEVHTLHEMHQLLDQQTQAAQGNGSKPTVSGIGVSEATVEHVVSCDDDVLAWLDSMGMLDAPVGDPEDPSNINSANSGAISDYSDLLFDLRPSPSSSSSSSSSSSKIMMTTHGTIRDGQDVWLFSARGWLISLQDEKEKHGRLSPCQISKTHTYYSSLKKDT